MKKVIISHNAPAPIGPYSQAILANNTLYCSGQIPIDPSTGDLITTSVEAETHQVMKNISEVLSAADMTFENVVKCSIFLKDMNDFARVNEVYGSYFSDEAPARETVQVSRLPKDVSVEISVISVK